MNIIKKKVIIKESVPGRADAVFAVRNLPYELLYRENGKLQEGVNISQTGDGGFFFPHWSRQSKERLAIIDRYIDSVWPRTQTLPKRIPNQQMIGLTSSAALTMAEMESRLNSEYGVPFLDLPIPEKLPVFEKKTTSEYVAASYKRPDYFDPESSFKDESGADLGEKPAINIPPVKSEDEQTLQCAQCEFVGKNPHSLAMHIRHRHKEVREGAAINNT